MENMSTSPLNDTIGEATDILEQWWLRGIFILLYAVIFLLGVSGNSLVVFVVLRNNSMQTITNIFITNLALSDIMMCLLAVPFTPLSAFLNSWIFGDALCHIVPMTLGVSVYVSTLTSTAIAIDRYFVIVHPFKPRMKIFVCILLIVAIWIISISISLPLSIYQKVSLEADNETYTCHEYWPKTTARQFFTVTSLILQYVVPCSIITFCYTKVSLVLRNRSKTKIGCGNRNRDRDEMEIRRKRRTNKMLIAMVSIFVCCWLPLNVVHITQEYHESVNEWQWFYFIFFVAHVIAMSSTIYNPFLYAWMNDNFKKEFKTVIPCLFSSTPSGHRSLNGGGGMSQQYTTVETQHTQVVNRSPPKQQHNGGGKASYDVDAEKVLLKTGEDDTTTSVVTATTPAAE